MVVSLKDGLSVSETHQRLTVDFASLNPRSVS